MVAGTNLQRMSVLPLTVTTDHLRLSCFQLLTYFSSVSETLNMSKALSSTRYGFDGNTTTAAGLTSSERSSWNDTPLSLLYSQKGAAESQEIEEESEKCTFFST